MPSGEVTIEILFDPPGHVRLPITDDEIVSRILAIEPLAGRPVTLVTYDTGQATRGRTAGLQVSKLSKPADPQTGGPAESKTAKGLGQWSGLAGRIMEPWFAPGSCSDARV